MRRMRARGRQPRVEGSSPVTAVFGITIFLGFLLLASQVLVHLYATSVVTAVAFDTARDAAAEGRSCQAAGPSGSVRAEVVARGRLGRYGERPGVTVGCSDDGDTTTVTIRAPSPARALSGPIRPSGLDVIERTASVRTERVR